MTDTKKSNSICFSCKHYGNLYGSCPNLRKHMYWIDRKLCDNWETKNIDENKGVNYSKPRLIQGTL